MIHDVLKKVHLTDKVLALRQKIGREVTIPSAIARSHETGRVEAFKLNWKEGMENQPHFFWDSDVAKVLEGMAESLMVSFDPALAKELDELVDLVISAAHDDGYLNIYFSTVAPEERWTNLGVRHELYCAGHLIEAAVAHFEATGERKFLDTMCRYADYIDRVFGREPDKKRGYPGHEELELALVKLYRVTGEKRYLDLAGYFIDERGQSPNYFGEVEKTLTPRQIKNVQAHKPVREQHDAVGHAVRAVYLYSGMIDAAVEKGDEELKNVCIRLFDSIADRRMYVTGGIGSTSYNEEFTNDYDLPANSAYAESCASIGLALFSKRMLEVFENVKYADVLERCLYNNCLSGISLEGDQFFYANPHQALPDEVRNTEIVLEHLKKVRQRWFSCSCCPTNYCRFLAQLAMFCVRPGKDVLSIDIPAACDIETEDYSVKVLGGYPDDGNVSVAIVRGGTFTLRLRIPSWCGKYSILVNGREAGTVKDGYWQLEKQWQKNDRIDFTLDIPVRLVYANANVSCAFGKAVVMRGPQVFVLEEHDNPGIILHTAAVSGDTEFAVESAPDLPEGSCLLKCKGKAVTGDAGELYRSTAPVFSDVELHFIPYALWQNRSIGGMQVFINAL